MVDRVARTFNMGFCNIWAGQLLPILIGFVIFITINIAVSRNVGEWAFGSNVVAYPKIGIP